MTHEQLLETLRRALTEVSPELAGKPMPGSAKPIGGLGLDSLHGVHFRLCLEELLETDLPLEENPLVDDAARRARTLDEVADWVLQKVPGLAGETAHVR